VAALTAVLDVCAFVLASARRGPIEQARLTFAIARHALMDMCRVFHQRPAPPREDRLPEATLRRLLESFEDSETPVVLDSESSRRLSDLRAMYEPAANALSKMLLRPLPAWSPPGRVHDNWMSTM